MDCGTGRQDWVGEKHHSLRPFSCPGRVQGLQETLCFAHTGPAGCGQGSHTQVTAPGCSRLCVFITFLSSLVPLWLYLTSLGPGCALCSLALVLSPLGLSHCSPALLPWPAGIYCPESSEQPPFTREKQSLFCCHSCCLSFAVGGRNAMLSSEMRGSGCWLCWDGCSG